MDKDISFKPKELNACIHGVTISSKVFSKVHLQFVFHSHCTEPRCSFFYCTIVVVDTCRWKYYHTLPNIELLHCVPNYTWEK